MLVFERLAIAARAYLLTLALVRCDELFISLIDVLASLRRCSYATLLAVADNYCYGNNCYGYCCG